MYIGLFDVWKRILQSLGLIPPANSRFILKTSGDGAVKRIKPPEFECSKQVRVLLFRELNGQERRLLFDSKAVRKRDLRASPGGGGKPPPGPPRHHQDNSIEKSFKLGDNQSREYVYEWQKSSSDESLIREMIFGSVSISYQGTTLKIHSIRSPPQIMLSLVFPAPPVAQSRNCEQDTEESGNWTSSIEVNINNSAETLDVHLAHSVPVNVPSRLSGQYTTESRDSDSDSLQSHDGHSSLPTTHLSPECPAKGIPRSSSYNSLQRRILRNKATSIEFGLPKSEDSGSEYPRTPGQKRSKLGLSIVINLSDGENKPENRHFVDFLFTHISLIEGHLIALKDTVIRAYLNRKNFVHLMFEGSKRFQNSLHDLYTAPRLQNPEWLTIISSPNHRHLSYAFLERFTGVLRQYDKKETNFFVSTLLTAVLTHHLAWVPSVIPTDSKIQSTQSSHKHIPYWVDLLAKSRPYNPLWVQLNDMYGALGVPLKITKAVVKGQRRDVVLKFLKVLSYFIRCSDIRQQVYERMEETENESFNIKLSASSGSPSPKAFSESKAQPSPITPVENGAFHNRPIPMDAHPLQSSFLPPLEDLNLPGDTCEVTVTPVEDRTHYDLTCHSSINAVTVPTEEENANKDSLGYISLEEKLENMSVSKRPALRETPTNCSHATLSTPSVFCPSRPGKENDPTVGDCVDACRTSKQKACKCPDIFKDGAAASLLSRDLHVCAEVEIHLVVDVNRGEGVSESKDYGSSTEECVSGSPKTKECESSEEGYHSMEEPHSPGGDAAHLGEMMKRMEHWHPDGCEERSLPGLYSVEQNTEPSPHKSFGWSLMAEISDHYLSDFCLQGLSGPLVEEEVRRDLLRSTQIHVLGEPVSEAVCLVADTDKWTVSLLSSHFLGVERADTLGSVCSMSSLVSGICDSILNMVDLGIPPESCIIYLEDRLQELYTRSQTLADYVRTFKGPVPQSKIVSALNVDVSDLPLLLAIATTHSPNLSVYSR